MANITPARTNPLSIATVDNYTWETITTSNTTGLPIVIPHAADKTVHVTGTFGAAATILIEGSNDGTNYITQTDSLGNNLSFTAAGMEVLLMNPTYLRARLSSGGAAVATLIVEEIVAS
jgi:hypothetical protein